ncbi:ABC transporter permease subunit [Streptomyces odontomachi]|uniref:ABC transporter permease subunit n=1 Tax=Streptomyces odontomachi TaxID=2944940 RepID=UPI00210CFC38|nr:ABC transporter permease subunit [Streptomyces sp. ODS25]
MTTTAAPRPTTRPQRESFRLVLRSEWTKFRTIRGWLIGLGVAVVLCTTFTFLVANGTHEGTCTGTGSTCRSGHPYVATGPDGEAAADSYQFVERPLTGDATITARVRSLTGVTSTNQTSVAPSLAHTRPGLAAWAKAGILLRPSTKQGSPYAAVMVTGAHGVRFQYDYTHDRAGRSGPVSDTAPRWLRLTRTGATLTGYDSVNGTAWTRIGTAHLAGLPATVHVGLFVTSPVSFDRAGSGFATRATATFDHVTQGAWHEQSIGARDFYPKLPGGGYHRVGSSYVLSGSGDIAPAVVEGLLSTGTPSSTLVLGIVVGLVVITVIATMFITVEYRRGLIRTTFAATPLRHRVLAAKAVVIGAAAFVIGTLAAAVAVPLGEHLLEANGDYVFPVGTPTVARVIAGAGALVALTAVAVLAVGTIVRKSAGAVTAGIVVFVLPYVIGSSLSGAAERWLFRLTPAAGFSVLGTLPRSAQVAYPYTMANGYYPLSWWAGLAVLCGYAALALGIAAVTLHRRDA